MPMKHLHKWAVWALVLLLVPVCLSSCESSNGETLSDKPVADSSALGSGGNDAGLPLNRLNLPPGFSISVYAQVPNARSMALSPSGVLYVGNRSGDKVYAVRDTDGDNRADERFVLASGLRMPNGVAFKDGHLYVAEVSRILRLPNIESRLDNPPTPEVVYDGYPTDRHHGWKYIAFGPDGLLYVPVGAPCNICESDEIYASITRLDVNNPGKPEIYASGVRNTVGFTWHPDNGQLFFTDNGRDHLGDNYPPCELNVATAKGQHFGYPYCHGKDIADPEFGQERPCTDFKRPLQPLGPHVAPLGLSFYRGNMFPAAYQQKVFIAEHGSWNRSKKIGYRISLVTLDAQNRATSYSTFIDGWLNDNTQDQWGRPVDVITMPDGAMLISDDYAGAIYRVTYQG